MANKIVIPPVPKGLDRALTQFLNSAREQMQTLGGKGRADPKDRAITFRDWEKANGRLSLRTLDANFQFDNDDNVFYDDPTPSIPTGVEIFPTFNTVLCRWDRVSTEWYASTQIFRLTVDEDTVDRTFSASIQVGAVASPFFTDYLQPNTTAIYWIRHVNRDGVFSPVHATDGTEVTTYETPLQVLTEYSRDIYNGENYQWLRGTMGVMDAINRAYGAAGVSPDSNLFTMLQNSESLSDLLANQALADSLDKHQTKYEISAQFSKNYARLEGGIHAAVNPDEAYVNRIQTLESQFVNDLDGIIQSKIDTFELSLSAPDGAVATQIGSLTVSYDGNQVSLDTLAQVVANVDGDYSSQWGVKTNVNGLQGGVGFFNDGVKTSFIVDAQEFAVIGGANPTQNPDGTGVIDEALVPFVVRDGRVVMQDAFIDHAKIWTLIANDINADTITASIKLTSPLIEGGTIDGTLVTADNAIIRGHIQATTGTLKDVVIDETCTINGSLSAVNIEGDVVDRLIIPPDDFVSNPIYNGVYIIGDDSHILAQGNIIAGVVGADADRYLLINGMSFYSNPVYGEIGGVDIELRLDGFTVQQLITEDIPPGITRDVQIGCVIPKGVATRNFSVHAKRRYNTDNLMLELLRNAIVVDVFKIGSTVQDAQGPRIIGFGDS